MILKNTKLIKTIVFAAIVLTLVIPMAGIKMVDAKLPGRDIVNDKPSYDQIPVQQELRNGLMAKLQVADSESSKKEIESELGKIDTSVQKWFKDHTDPEKEKLAGEKQKILEDALMVYQAKFGFTNSVQYLPWTTIGYDYVDNALEVTILPEYFNVDALPKYFEKIRSIVGNEIDIALSPAGYPTLTPYDVYKDLSPLKQLKYVSKPTNVLCKENFILIFKHTNGSPACVKPASVQKLVAWGWAKPIA